MLLLTQLQEVPGQFLTQDSSPGFRKLVFFQAEAVDASTNLKAS